MSKIHANVFPLLALVAMGLYTIYIILFDPVYVDGEAYPRTFDYHHYSGFALLLISLGLYVAKSHYFKYSVLVLLLLWLVGVTNYLPLNLHIGVKFGEAGLFVQVGALVFMIVYYLINEERANKKLGKLISLLAGTSSADKAKRNQRAEIDKFKSTFRRYSIEKLQAIVMERKLVNNAVIAAKELLAEKSVTADQAY